MPVTNNKSNEELDKIIEEGETAIDDTVEETTDEITINESDAEQDSAEDSIDEVAENDEVAESADEPEQDYETRYKESTKEATTLHFRNKEMKDAVKDAKTLGDPTEEEIRSYAERMGEDYDRLDKFTQNILRQNLKNEKRFDRVASVIEEKEELDNWVGDVTEFVNNESVLNKYPTLANRTNEFIRFSSKKSRRGMDMEDLIAAFMYSEVQDAPRKRGSLLLDRGGGQDKTPPKKGLDEDDLRALRSSKDGQKKYKEAVKAGKIDIKL